MRIITRWLSVTMCAGILTAGYFSLSGETPTDPARPFSGDNLALWVRLRACEIGSGTYLPHGMRVTRHSVSAEARTWTLILSGKDAAAICHSAPRQLDQLLGDNGAQDAANEERSGAAETREEYWAQRLGLVDGRLPEGAKQRALEQRARMLELSEQKAPQRSAPFAAAAKNWSSLGPTNIPGHVESFAFDPSSPNRILVGSNSGGIWATPDLGKTWTQYSDAVPKGRPLRVAFSTSAPNIAFAYVEEYGGGTSGFYRSMDGGVTWTATLLESQASKLISNSVAGTCSTCVPQLSSGIFATSSNEALDPRIIVAMAGFGYAANGTAIRSVPTLALFFSDDQGQTWSLGYQYVGAENGFFGAVVDVIRDPNDPKRVFVSTNGGGSGRAVLAASNDGGVTGSPVQLPSGAGTRPKIAFAKNAKGTVYALTETLKNGAFGNLGPLYRSSDGGQTWSVVSSFPCPASTSYFCAPSGGYGGYGNVIWIDPTNSNRIVVGGVGTLRSLDGGQSFQIANLSLHDDTHALVPSPAFDGVSNKTLFVAVDGGISQTLDYTQLSTFDPASGKVSGSVGWTRLGDGLGGSEIYHVSASTPGDTIMSGFQDNGCDATSGSLTWTFLGCGDGFTTAFDPRNSFIRYLTSQNAQVSRTGVMTGSSYQVYAVSISGGITDGASMFDAYITLDPGNPNRLYVATPSLWVTDNAKAASVSWRQAKPPRAPYAPYPQTPSYTVSAYATAIAVKPGDSNTVYVGYNDGQIEMTANALSANPTWSVILPYDSAAGFVTSLDTDPANANFLYAAFSSYGSSQSSQKYGTLIRIAQPGNVIQDLSSGLPVAPMNSVAVDPANHAHLYVGSDIGIFESNDYGASWSALAGGPGDFRIMKLLMANPTGTLYAATFGDGVWRLSDSAMPAAPPAPDSGLWWNPAEPGRGYGIQANSWSGNIFFAAYQYEATSQARATWYIATLTPDQTSASGHYGGTLTAYSNSSGSPVGTPIGQMSIDFSTSSQGTVTWPAALTSKTTPIQRYAIDGVSVKPPQTDQTQWSISNYGTTYNGWWWDPKNPGRGYMMEQQGTLLFVAQFTYRADGSAVWYAATCSGVPKLLPFYSCPMAEYAGGNAFVPSGRNPTSTAIETDEYIFGCPNGCSTPQVIRPNSSSVLVLSPFSLF